MRLSPRVLLASTATAFSLALAAPAWAGPQSGRCEDLARLQLPDTVIESAQPVAAGEFIGPDKVKLTDLPAFCRVVASVRSAPDSDVKLEIWLPSDHWSGVFHGNGNGGFGGSVTAGYGGKAEGLTRGYASASTDMGTAPANMLNGDALIGHPRKWKDWGRLSTHAMTVAGKAIAKAYYAAPVRRAYYTGCSSGGQEGLIEAEYYPEDYDGVLIGAPVINRTWGHAAVLWDWLAANRAPGAKLSNAKLTLLNTAAIVACSGEGNGLAGDPFIADPMACRFDPASLLCHGADASACLTAAEVATAQAFYSGPRDHAGRATYYGWLPGSEAPVGLGWSFLQAPPNGEPAFDGLFKWVFGASWDPRAFDFDRDMPRVDAALGGAVNDATLGDMRRFRARGGKLIIYHGWADTLVAPGQTVALYDRMRRPAGRDGTNDFARLFMAPGMMHCGGGSGPGAFNSTNPVGGKPPSRASQYDLFTALSEWVEDGVAPSQVIATTYSTGASAGGVALQRPLCPYPLTAWYKGAGDRREAASFACAAARPSAPAKAQARSS